MNETHELDSALSALIGNTQPSERKKLMRTLAQDVRRAQQKTIALQKNPDGTTFVPRKAQARDKKGRIKSKKMFQKIKAAKFLKVGATADSASVFFAGSVMKIARIHHYGLRDKVGRVSVKYPERQLLGITDEISDITYHRIIDWLSR